MGILEELGKRILFFDGGTGSLLQERGLKPGELPETWNLLKPEVVTELHRNYLEAGSDVVLTNTFGANRLKYDGEKNPDVRRVVEAAVKNARAAVDSYEKETGRRGYVALDMGPTGKLLKPMGDLDFEDACALFGEVAETGTRAGADCILIETMSDGYEVKAAVLGAKEHSHLPVFVTMTFDEKGKLLTGGNAASAVALLEGLGVDALGINCGLGPVQMKEIVGQILAEASIPVLVKPNAGLPRSENGRTVYDIDADAFAREMEEMASMGLWMMGGCCGTTPEHIRKTVERCRAIVPKPIEEKQRTVISSWSHRGGDRGRSHHRGGADQPHREIQDEAGAPGERPDLHPGGGSFPAGEGGPRAGRECGPAGDRRAGDDGAGGAGAAERPWICPCRSIRPIWRPWSAPCGSTTESP